MSTPRIAFIGAGNMAASLIGGLRAQGVPAAQIRASDPGAEQRAKIAGEFAIDVVESNAEAVADADVVVLSVKPQGDAYRRQQLPGLLALRGADLRVGVQPAGALAQQRRGVGHAADHRARLAEPGFEAGAGDAGGDGDDQLLRLQRRRQGLAHGVARR